MITPGGSAGEPLRLLSALERHSDRWQRDAESARSALSAAVSLVLRLLGREADPAKSREHVLLSVLAERRLQQDLPAELGGLLEDLANPPIESIGALSVDDFLPRAERRSLAAALNTLLASPTFATWREGVTLDLDEWLTPKDGRTPGVIVSTAHLDDEERTLVLGVLLEELLSWVRTLPGSQRLRALVVFDEVYGFLPPHPANPPTKRPLVALLKQARAFGGDDGLSQSELGAIVKKLSQRWFLLRNASPHPNARDGAPFVVQASVKRAFTTSSSGFASTSE